MTGRADRCRLQAILAAAAMVCVCGPMPAGTLQLLCLSNTPTAARFVVPADRVWPVTTGAPELCLWDDDRLAAITVTIDDNHAENQTWWQSIAASTGMRFTWFVISGNVGSDGSTWAGFQTLYNGGHGVQSHAVTALNNTNPPWPGIIWEYYASQTSIAAMVTGDRVLTLAYPNGLVPPNNRTNAAQYYAAARGVVGEPNRVNLIDYLNTKSVSRTSTLGREYTDAVHYGTSSVSWLNNVIYRRGWLCAHYHGVSTANQPGATDSMTYIASQSNDLWTARFDEIIRYGQERDTARLTVLTNSERRVTFDLADDMYDAWYDYPLTVKLRQYAAWTNPVAVQGSAVLPVRTVVSNGIAYALIRVVPDRGAAMVMDRATDADGDDAPDWCELVAGTNPDDASDYLALAMQPLALREDVIELRWPSVSGRWYSVYAAPAATGAFVATACTNMPATPPYNVVTAAAPPAASWFYDLRVW